MHTTLFAATLLASIIAGGHCAPAVLTGKALMQNAEAAQKLNVQFQTMNLTTPCSNFQQACIDGNLATCEESQYNVTQTCQSGTSCFAIPNAKISGTKLICTTEKNASEIIEAAGATGGVAGCSGGVVTKTVTVTATPVLTSSFAETATITGTDLSAIIASITGAPGVSVVTDPASSTLTAVTSTATGSEVETITVLPAELSSVLSSLSEEGFTVVATITDAASSATTTSLADNVGVATLTAMTSTTTHSAATGSELETITVLPAELSSVLSKLSKEGFTVVATITDVASFATTTSHADNVGVAAVTTNTISTITLIPASAPTAV